MPTPLTLSQPLHDVRLVRRGEAPAADKPPANSETAPKLGPELLKASYERGRSDGERAMGDQLIRQRAELVELQTGVLTALRESIPQVARECEQALVALALEVAQKLVAGLPVSPEMVEAAVKEALAQVEDGAEVTALLHPDDLALLERMTSPQPLPLGAGERVRYSPSAQVSRGGCLVQTRFGLIDGRRETKLEVLKKALAP